MTPSKTKTSSSKSKKETTFFDILKQDHDTIRDLFEQIEEDEESGNREELFAGIQSELQEHLELEEKIFYPEMEKSEELRDKALEAYEEHHVARMVLGELSGLDKKDDRWNAKLKVLQEVVLHHLQEEEKNVFKLARKSFESDQITQITNQIRQMKSGMAKKAA